MEYLDSAVAAVRLLLGRVKVNATRFRGRRRDGQRWRQVGAMNWNGLFSKCTVCLAFFSRESVAECGVSVARCRSQVAEAGGVHAASAADVL